MTISTNFQFNQAIGQMQDLQSSINRIQSQVSSGLNLTHPSDNPDKLNAIQRIQSALSRQENYTQILGSVGDRLKAEETGMRSASDLLARMKELLLQASNATASPTDRKNIAAVMQSTRGELQALASTRDVDGHYLFSGTRAGAAPFGSSSSNDYQGDQTQSDVPIDDARTIKIGRPGPAVFGGVVRDTAGDSQRIGFFQVIDDAINAVSSNNTQNMSRAIGEFDGLNDHLAMAQANNGADQKTVEGQRSLIDETTLRLKSTLSGLRDIDMTEAITRLQKESIGLQAAQSTFARTSSLNLFNFLK